jgi:imidazole glycerol-phosphate synthase subunit HisH
VIAVVDYGRGNLGSVEKAFGRLGMRALVTEDPAVVADAEAVALPGDGAFHDAMSNLHARGLLDSLRDALASEVPFLGICLGYQLLFTESEEFGHAKGLDLLPGTVRRLPPGLKVPHMGWNQLWHDGTLPLLAGIPAGAYFYFVHSYYPDVSDALRVEGMQVAHCEYGLRFPALVVRDQLYGTQFHPEKSQGWGLRLLANFARLAGGGAAAPA